MTNHPNRSKISYTFFDGQDSGNATSGLTISEARALHSERGDDRFEIMSDADFQKYLNSCASDTSLTCEVVDGITKII